MGIRVNHDHGRFVAARQPALPGVSKNDVSRREQRREIPQRTAMCNQTRRSLHVEAEFGSDPIDHRPLDGSRPGPHLVNRHHLIRHRSDEVE